VRLTRREAGTDGYRVGAAAAFVTVSEEPPAYASHPVAMLDVGLPQEGVVRYWSRGARFAVDRGSGLWRWHSSSTEGGALTDPIAWAPGVERTLVPSS
jgi:hypothetical protein